MPRTPYILLIAAVLCAGCGKDNTATTGTDADPSALPAPATAGTSITGMPNPGVATPQPPPLRAATPDPEATDIDAADPTVPAAAEPATDAPMAPTPAPSPLPAIPNTPTPAAPTTAPAATSSS